MTYPTKEVLKDGSVKIQCCHDSYTVYRPYMVDIKGNPLPGHLTKHQCSDLLLRELATATDPHYYPTTEQRQKQERQEKKLKKRWTALRQRENRQSLFTGQRV